MPPYPGVRDRLEKILAESHDPDVRAQAQALLGVLAVYEAHPYGVVPTHQLYAILHRHLIKDEDVLFYPENPVLPDRKRKSAKARRNGL